MKVRGHVIRPFENTEPPPDEHIEGAEILKKNSRFSGIFCPNDKAHAGNTFCIFKCGEEVWAKKGLKRRNEVG